MYVPYKLHGAMCAVVIHTFVSLRHSRLLPCAIPTYNSYYALSERCTARGVQREVYSERCAVRGVQREVYSERCTVRGVQ